MSMKYIITESSLHKLINKYLNSLKLESELFLDEIFVSYVGDDYVGALNYFYDENELAIDPFLISMVSGLYSIDREQAMEGIAMWFENKFNVDVLSAREWDW
jgi:hypothetical protein